MQKTIFAESIPDGGTLELASEDALYGFGGLTVYMVSYLDEDPGGTCQESGIDCFVSEADATDAFNRRKNSDKPWQILGENDIYNLVAQLSEKYLDTGRFGCLGRIPPHWDGTFASVLERTFGGWSPCFDGEGIMALLRDLRTTSTEGPDKTAKLKLELPAWKVLELIVAIATLSMMVRKTRGDLERETLAA